jgi:hypothetical protein
MKKAPKTPLCRSQARGKFGCREIKPEETGHKPLSPIVTKGDPYSPISKVRLIKDICKGYRCGGTDIGVKQREDREDQRFVD